VDPQVDVIAFVGAASPYEREAMCALAAPLLTHGEGEVLLRTVECFLRANGSTAKAARALFVHRNTVSYRLRTVQRRCGAVVAGNAERVAWTIALVALGRHDVLTPL
jgi:sugar diacid utilization regulator